MVNPDAVLDIVRAGRIPVVAGVAPDIEGTVYNINADSAAAALAAALGAAKLVVLTDVEGLFANWPDRESVISELTAAELEPLLAGPGQRHGSEDGGLPARGARRRAEGPRDRRAGAALGAPGSVHLRRRGNDGGAVSVS